MKFRNLELITDKDFTAKIYNTTEGGIADGCGCNNCKNFISNRETIFYQEIKNLFSELGVDYKKECDNMHCFRLESGLHLYIVLFHFKGEIKNLGNENISISLNENLDINFGLANPNSETFFPNRDNLSQVEFHIKMPWTIEKEFESE